MSGAIKKVVIVGAGPCGTLLGLLLSQHGIAVDVLESGAEIDPRPRGLAYGPAGVQAIRRAGVLGEIRQQTYEMKTMSWRRANGDLLTGIHSMDEADCDDRFLLFPVHKLAKLLADHLEEFSTASVLYNHSAVDVGQDDDKAWVDVRMTETGETKRFEGDLIVGCDGASSIVRKSLYGREFPGMTWDFQMMVSNIQYDMDGYGWSDCQWIVDPQDWGMVCKSEPGDNWRVAYSEPKDMPEDELRTRFADRLEKILPGAPKPDDYEVTRLSWFTAHQRCAPNMRVGRVLLVGDAAHLCNPMGGLGLTGGLADTSSLVDVLYGINDRACGFDMLDKWDEVRRTIYKDYINQTSTTNLKRVRQDPEGIVKTDPLLQMIESLSNDPKGSANLQMRELCVAHDMTQYFPATKA